VHLLEVVIACEEEFGVVFHPLTDFTEDKHRTVRAFDELIIPSGAAAACRCASATSGRP